MRNFLLLIPVFCALTALARAEAPLDTGYRQMYNLQFPEAHETFRQYQAERPDDPMGPVSDAAAYLFSEFDRLHILQSEFFTHDQHFITDHKLTPDPGVKRKFEAALAKTRELAARAKDDNASFASILAGGLQSDYMALIEKRYVASFKQMKASRQQAEQLLTRKPQLYDAWLAIGVENYMLSIKPVVIRWFLRLGGGETDRDLGIQKLKLTAERGHYLAPFAQLLLAVAALRDKDTNRARQLLAGLAREYPHNPLYPQELERIGSRAAPAPSGRLNAFREAGRP
ncbi:MAG: hypothetical protein LAQ30_14335 [Acidobacteriia bacterium]|nr:hypothetical protein [Terriglobia bacterium]